MCAIFICMPLRGRTALALVACSSAPEALSSEKWISMVSALSAVTNMAAA